MTGKPRISIYGLVLGLSMATTALAQSPNAALMGEAEPGSTAIIQNMATGFTREVKVKENGRYALRSLPTGTFSVIIRKPDGSLEAPRVVTLRVGSTARVK